MGMIQVLDHHIANMIAAGEVVERPASVVKELVENSIDAGSTQIEVHIQEGGLRSIVVTDNGCGMEAEDCELCIERHATSKIKKDRDLFQIATLGFRGEALPSIAAVSRLELASCPKDGELGTKILVEGGAIIDQQAVARPKGTEVRVNDLFYNTPARLKYLKSIQTEVGHIADYLNRLALAHPHISFLFTSDGRTLLRTYGDGQLLHVIGAVYGMPIAKAMIPIQSEDLDFTIHGYIGNPQVTRANRSYITILVNGRYVRSHAVTSAILRGYHTLLPINRYPLAVLDIRMEPSLVDVNVHPAKLEVRFSKEQELLGFVEASVSRVLRGQRLIPEPARTMVKPQSVQTRLNWDYPSAGHSQWMEDMIREVTISGTTEDGKREERTETQSVGKPLVREEHRSENPTPPKAPHPCSEEAGEAGSKPNFQADPEVSNRPSVPFLQPLSQLHGTYILAQSEEGLFIIDQHAAQERIWYEYFMNRMREEAIEMQDLMVPIAIDLSVKEMQQVQEKRELLQNAGIDLEFFGNQTFLVRSHPRWFVAGEEEAIIHEMVDMIVRGADKIDTVKLREKTAMMMACKAAVKANRHLSMREMEELLNSLRNTDSPYTCPHGRPIIVHFSTYEIEKMFKRVM